MFTNMKLGVRLALGFGIVIVLLIISTTVGYVGLKMSAADLERITNDRFPKTVMANNIVDAIVSFMNDNYMQPISLARISENAYLSPVYISRVFKELMGEAPINYLIRIRLAKAW